MTPRLEFRTVAKQFDTGAEVIHAVNDVSLTVAAGETVVLWGPSGSGKSTVLQLAAAICAPDHGAVQVDGQPLPTGSPSAEAIFRRRRVGYITQRPKLMPAATAVENAEVKLMLDGVGRREARDRAIRMLEDVGLGDRLKHAPAQLSGGEQQRVAIAQAVLNEPALLLADEPTAHLDSVNGREVFGLLVAHARRHGAGLLLVSHDEQAMQIADRVLHLRDGRLTD